MGDAAIQGWRDLGSTFFKLSGSAWALVPLEAWRRGLQVTLLPSARYRISDGHRSLTFWQTRQYGEEHERTVAIANDKQRTKAVLEAAGVRVPSGQYFSRPFLKSQILDYADLIGYPVCIKPNSLAKARGVFPGVQDKSTLARLLDYLIHELGTPDLLLEENISGHAIRVVVCGSEVVAATLSVPANVIGDGVSTIHSLIADKNARRASNPHLRFKHLTVDKEVELRLQEQGLCLDSIPDEGVRVFIRQTSNLSAGGDSYDVTESISETVRTTAIAAVQALPGLQHAGVDVLTEDVQSGKIAAVCEINASCGLGGHIYPAAGARRDVPAAFIDHHFPGTTRLSGSEHWHFALTQVERLFSSHTALAVELAPMPMIADQRWRRLEVTLDRPDSAAKRQQALSAVLKTGAHGEVHTRGPRGLDVYLTGAQTAVNRAQRVLEHLNGIAHVTTRSNQPFVASPGFRVA